MTRVGVTKEDLYYNGSILNLQSGQRHLIRTPRTVKPSANDRIHIIRGDETLFSIAYDYYGNSKYWHYLMDANISLFNGYPFTELEPGIELLIPNIENY